LYLSFNDAHNTLFFELLWEPIEGFFFDFVEFHYNTGKKDNLASSPFFLCFYGNKMTLGIVSIAWHILVFLGLSEFGYVAPWFEVLMQIP